MGVQRSSNFSIFSPSSVDSVLLGGDRICGRKRRDVGCASSFGHRRSRSIIGKNIRSYRLNTLPRGVLRFEPHLLEFHCANVSYTHSPDISSESRILYHRIILLFCERNAVLHYNRVTFRGGRTVGSSCTRTIVCSIENVNNVRSNRYEWNVSSLLRCCLSNFLRATIYSDFFLLHFPSLFAFLSTLFVGRRQRSWR